MHTSLDDNPMRSWLSLRRADKIGKPANGDDEMDQYQRRCIS